MKIYIDTADIDEIKEAYSTGNLDGVTTNNTSAAAYAKKKGRRMSPNNVRDMAYEIADVFEGDCSISIETVGTPDFNPSNISVQQIVDEVGVIYSWKLDRKKELYAKLPSTRKGFDAAWIIKQISGAKINATLGFSTEQGVNMAHVGADYFSPFVGRLENRGGNGIEVVENTLKIYEAEKLPTKLLFASVREINHVKEAHRLGCHIVTMPLRVFKQFTPEELYEMRQRKEPVGDSKLPAIKPEYVEIADELARTLTDEGLAKFIGDSKDVGYTLLERAGQT
ncbi:MAG: hypothetical protein HYX24_03465 [Candidatus Aenigmarchaeota archaeon]|nr:hypothetical protein [Candidatus Aenigmarchaeota archaeon]